jgi:hypothetical protein
MKKTLLVIALTLSANFTLWAQRGDSNALGLSGTDRDAPTALASHALKKTYLSVGGPGTTGSGFQTIDTQTVLCPGTSGNCVIQADQWVQLQGAFGKTALCLLIDGNLVDGCFFTGEALADGGFAQYSTTHGGSVSFGSHTVTTQVYTDGSALHNHFNITYRVYKP